ncbi:hypothetical protein BS50DRAFT_588275 [Corynespora cassiicola Philippines]|uniref:Uncharacterized protein n=1 Tax=Corynespora cassiicola Philippines TaxID=1448308 RepID=A0A2T2NPD3_CORCC|nr:hypothetical protein BS50DRAFT_588275 [Corynespora cassiicola Philippines]
MGLFNKITGKTGQSASSSPSGSSCVSALALDEVLSSYAHVTDAFAAAAVSGNRVQSPKLRTEPTKTTATKASTPSRNRAATFSAAPVKKRMTQPQAILYPMDTPRKPSLLSRFSRSVNDEKLLKSYSDFMVEYWDDTGAIDEEQDEDEAPFDRELNAVDDLGMCDELVENPRGGDEPYDIGPCNRLSIRNCGGNFDAERYPTFDGCPTRSELDKEDEAFFDVIQCPKDEAVSFVTLDSTRLMEQFSRLNTDQQEQEESKIQGRAGYGVFWDAESFTPGVGHLANPSVHITLIDCDRSLAQADESSFWSSECGSEGESPGFVQDSSHLAISESVPQLTFFDTDKRQQVGYTALDQLFSPKRSSITTEWFHTQVKAIHWILFFTDEYLQAFAPHNSDELNETLAAWLDMVDDGPEKVPRNKFPSLTWPLARSPGSEIASIPSVFCAHNVARRLCEVALHSMSAIREAHAAAASECDGCNPDKVSDLEDLIWAHWMQYSCR